MSAQPSAEEALNFADFFQIIEFDGASGSHSAVDASIGSLSAATQSKADASRGTDATRSSPDTSAASGSTRC